MTKNEEGFDAFLGSVSVVCSGTGMHEGQKIIGSQKGGLIVDAIPVVEIVLDGIILLPKG